jgi:hypothetical protein
MNAKSTKSELHTARLDQCLTLTSVEDVEDKEDEEDLFTHNDLLDLQDDLDDEEEEEEDEQLEEGDRIYTVDLTLNAEDIRARGNFSQHLTKAAHKNKKKKDF